METIPTFSKIIQETQDQDTLVDAAKALSCISYRKKSKVSA